VSGSGRLLALIEKKSRKVPESVVKVRLGRMFKYCTISRVYRDVGAPATVDCYSCR